jgi:hypothetical protein
MTFTEILRAMSATELAQAALSRACALLACEPAMRDSLHLALYRFEIELIQTEREVRGLADIDWHAQARIELEYRAPQPGKPGKPRAFVPLDDVGDATVAWCSLILGSIAARLHKEKEPEKSGVFAALAAALDSQLPKRPSRNAGLN